MAAHRSVRFKINLEGEPEVLVASTQLDYIIVEREMGRSVAGELSNGMLEPLLRLAWTAAKSSKVIDASVPLDTFICDYTVAIVSDDDELESGKA